MADKWPLANGNYSTAANWNGGTLPVDGDVIYLDNRTITLDQSVELPNADLRTTARSGGTAGGNLTWSSGTYRIQLREILAGTSTVISTSGTAGLTLGSNTILQGSNTASVRTLNFSSSGALVFEAGCQAKNGTGGSQAAGVIIGGTGSVTGYLDLVCQASTGSAPALTVSGTPTLSITGAIQHGFAGQTVDIGTSVGTWTITSETCAGTTTTSGNKISSSSSSFVMIRQSPTILTFPTTWGTAHISLSSTPSQSFEYRGDIEQPVGGSSTLWLNTSSDGVFRHRGTIYGPASATNTAMLFTSTGGAKFVLDKLQTNASGRMPSLSGGWCMRTDSQIIASTESTNVTLVPSTSAGDYPSAANVRSGTSYAYGALTGTCAVPAAGSVANGVSVDATTGTAVLTSAAAQSACNSALTAYETSGVASQADLAGVTVDLSGVLGYLTSILAIFAGMTSLPNWIRRIVRKDAGTAEMATAQSEINTGGTATFDGTTDSTEAIRDAAGGGSGDASQTTLLEVQATVEDIAATLSGTPIEATSRVASGGTITAYIGDDFRVRSDTELSISTSDVGGVLYTKWNAIGEENLYFGASREGSDAGAISGTVAAITSVGSGASQTVKLTVEITNCGSGLKPGTYEYQIEQRQAQGSDTDSFIEIAGSLILKRNSVA